MLVQAQEPASESDDETPKLKAIFLPKNPIAAAYMLRRLSNSELVAVVRSEPVLVAMLERNGLELKYRQGWDKTIAYAQALNNSESADLEQGYTHVGPQRADIKILIDGYSAAETLSRGQQKLVVCGLKLAQGLVLAEDNRGMCTYLVDDLPSELDQEHTARVCQLLSSLNAQVFITCIAKEDIAALWPREDTLGVFHVEQGLVFPEVA